MSKYTVFCTAMGWAGFVCTDRGIYASILPQRSRPDAESALLQRCPDRPELDPEAFVSMQRQIVDYLNGQNIKLTCQIDWSWASSFQKRILQHVMSIPRGSVYTYGEVAVLAGAPLAARAVGQALGANNVPIIIPCHRVVQKNHRLGGFTGAGIEVKAALLNLEGVDLKECRCK